MPSNELHEIYKSHPFSEEKMKSESEMELEYEAALQQINEEEEAEYVARNEALKQLSQSESDFLCS